MLTKKESEEYFEYLDSIKVEVLESLDLPIINMPKELHDDIKKHIEEHLQKINSYKNYPGRVVVDVYNLLIEYFNTVSPAFTSHQLLHVWNDLYNKSPENTLKFIDRLLTTQKDYIHAIHLVNKHKNELQSYNKVIDSTRVLIDAMEEYQCHYYGHMLQKNHHEIMDVLEIFLARSKKSYEEFKEHIKNINYISCDQWPLTRKLHGESGLAIFFARKIHVYFKLNFDSPLYKYIAEIINVIFKTFYTENDIIKHCSQMKLKE